MTRYLLDTNIISDATRPSPAPALAAWLETQADTDLFIAALTLGELRRGILNLPPGRKRADLTRWFDGPSGPPSLFAGRILPFDAASALAWANLMAEGRAIGRPRDALDMIIAATALTNACTIVTLNVRDFHGLLPFNPCASLESGP